MIPVWKLKRELARLGQQARSLTERFTDPRRQRELDAQVARGLARTDGKRPLTDRVALILIYQPNGIPQSLLDTCDWLAAGGYAPLIVSNTPLDNASKNTLAPHIWRVIERPNFGYDFGGYRDGLTSLAQSGVSPENLIILNDSVWVPTTGGEDLLQRIESHPADILGSILRVRGTERFLESYFYRIKGEVLTNPAFQAYWADLQLTSNKYYVIRRGERGFSAAMRAAGLTVAPLFAFDDLPAQMTGASNKDLEQTLRYAAYLDSNLSAERDALVQAADGRPDWRNAALDHMARALVKHQAYSCFPHATYSLGPYPFLKKSKDKVAQGWRKAYHAAVSAGHLPAPSPAIWRELEETLGDRR